MKPKSMRKHVLYLALTKHEGRRPILIDKTRTQILVVIEGLHQLEIIHVLLNCATVVPSRERIPLPRLFLVSQVNLHQDRISHVKFPLEAHQVTRVGVIVYRLLITESIPTLSLPLPLAGVNTVRVGL